MQRDVLTKILRMQIFFLMCLNNKYLNIIWVTLEFRNFLIKIYPLSVNNKVFILNIIFIILLGVNGTPIYFAPEIVKLFKEW